MAAILQFLSDHQSAAAPLLIVLMMLESAPVVGFLIPGVLILPVVGAVSLAVLASLFMCCFRRHFGCWAIGWVGVGGQRGIKA